MSTISRSAFCGSGRNLVPAFDVGTTYSGISYSVLDPGVIPEIKGVTKFPGQEYITGASKIPTIIYYDRAGNVKAVGAEAAEWFKLHLRSRVGAGKQIADKIPPLPLNKTAVEVFADFLAYLLKCAASFIQDTHANGVRFWESVKDQLDFVLSYPNGWEGAQQAEIRKAALLAKLIPDTTAGHARLSFVTEGEASLHFAIRNGLPKGVMKDGEGVVVVDAGGGTIDISSYSMNGGEAKTKFEEVAPPQGHFYGSVFVTVHARQFLENYLQNSTFLANVEHIVDKTTKLRFRNSDEPQYIKFGAARDNDQSCNIRFGQLKLLGSDVAKFFQPSVECLVNAVIEQCKKAHKPISHVILVGGFATSDSAYVDASGTRCIPGTFDIILPKNTQVSDTKEFRESYQFEKFQDVTDFVWCYRGELVTPRWKDVDTQNYTTLCTLKVDLPQLPISEKRKASGSTYYHLDYDIILLFGLTELKAMVAWKENGVERRSPAKIICDPDDYREDN